ncbi:MAG: cytidine deaminase [Acholeplasmatales bacterium]|nr:cytidine deaminase [Acholeplasmatales bacterium]
MELFLKAKDATIYSYSPYSNFKVGCAIELKNGKFICGTNIENISYGLSMCAERVTIFKAISEGYDKDDIKAMAVYAETKDFVRPCGACLQVLSELLNRDCKIYLLNKNLESKEVTIEDLLPMGFNSLE